MKYSQSGDESNNQYLQNEYNCQNEQTNELQNHREDEAEPIYIMTVELEEGKSQAIKIFANSTPSELAFEFCKQNNLDVNALNYLSEQIKILLEELNSNMEYSDKENNKIGSGEQECIQEVDEEEYQTETRKTHKSGNNNSQTPNSPINPTSQYDNDSEFSKNFKHVYSKNLKNQAESNNTMPEVGVRHQLSGISNFDQIALTKLSSNSRKNIVEMNEKGRYEGENMNFDEAKITRSKSGVLRNKQNIPTSNTPLARDSKDLEEMDLAEIDQTQEIEGGVANLSKSKTSQEDITKNSQRLFSYQVFYDNFKKLNIDKNISTSGVGNQSIGVKIEKNGSISNSQTQNASNTKLVSQTDNTNIFERLFRNSEVKRFGANMKVRYDSYIPKNMTATANSSYLSRKENILNLSHDMTNSGTKPRNTRYRNGEVINYGERLYQKGLQLKEETKKKLESYKKERDHSNSAIYTYKPVINEITPELMRKRSENILNIHNEDYTMKYNMYIEEKFEKLRNKHENRDDLLYSYAPNINRNSSKMANEKLQAKVLARVYSSESPDMHRMRIEDLYESAKVKEFKIQELGKRIYSVHNYKPQLNTVNPSKLKENPLLSLTFNQRLDVFRQKSQERKKQLVENVCSTVDPKTGQSFFVPKLMSKSRERMNIVNVSSGDNSRQHTSNLFNNMYSYAQKYSKNKVERLKESDTTIKKFSGSVHTINDSEAIFMKKKDETFRKIFRILDSDQDNQISSVNIDLKKIPANIVSILAPITSELKEENETLNGNEFVRACEHLYEMLGYNQKRTLLEFEKKLEENKKSNSLNFSFKPTIDRNSKRIADSKQFTYSYFKTNPITTENKLNSLHNSSIGEDYIVMGRRSGKSLQNFS